jgi:preprotein translocase subunit YajC
MFTPGKWLRAAAIAIVSLVVIFGIFTFLNIKQEKQTKMQ